MANFTAPAKPRSDDRTSQFGNTGMAVADRAKDAANSVGEKAKDAAHTVAEKAKDLGQSAADKAKDVANSVSDKAKEMASAVAHGAEDASSYVSQKAVDATSSVGCGLKSLSHTIRENTPNDGMIGEASSAVANSLESTGRYLQEEGLKGIADDMTNMIRRNPIPALLVGVGVGFLIARATTARS